MITVVMRVKNILYRFLSCLFDIRQTGLRTTWEIGVYHNQVIFHLNPNVVAMTFVFELSFTEPDPRSNQLYISRGRLGLMMRCHQPGNS